MNNRENYLRTIYFNNPERIIMSFYINPSCFELYDKKIIIDMMKRHKKLFPSLDRFLSKFPPLYAVNARKDKPYIDEWGCKWVTTTNGITGTVIEHPLADLAKTDEYNLPRIKKYLNPSIIRGLISLAKKCGFLSILGLPHGHTFLKLSDICGYENLLFAMCDEDKNFLKLLKRIEEYNVNYVKKIAELKPDIISLPEDLGMQIGPMLSPEHFRSYIKPIYKKMISQIDSNSTAVHMHSDGDIRLLYDDIMEAGVNIINLQDTTNGIDWIAENIAGKYAIELDIDRRLPWNASDINGVIREYIGRLSTLKGGLMLKFGLYGGLPYDKIEALMTAMENNIYYYQNIIV